MAWGHNAALVSVSERCRRHIEQTFFRQSECQQAHFSHGLVLCGRIKTAANELSSTAVEHHLVRGPCVWLDQGLMLQLHSLADAQLPLLRYRLAKC